MVATDFSQLQFHAVRSKKKLAVLDSCVIVDITWFLLTKNDFILETVQLAATDAAIWCLDVTDTCIFMEFPSLLRKISP